MALMFSTYLKTLPSDTIEKGKKEKKISGLTQSHMHVMYQLGLSNETFPIYMMFIHDICIRLVHL